MDRNKDSHGTSVYYWVAEIDTTEHEMIPEIYSIYLHEFYSSDQYENCCANKEFDPYSYTAASEFDFPKNYSNYLTELKEQIRSNRIKLQVIKKEWKENHKEKIIVYGTALKGKLCECEFGGRYFLNKGDRISFPKGKYEIVEDYWTNEKALLIYKDFFDFHYSNTN